MKSFVFEKRYYLGFNLCDYGLYGSMPQGGARGQNLGHLRFIFPFTFCCLESLNLNNRYC